MEILDIPFDVTEASPASRKRIARPPEESLPRRLSLSASIAHREVLVTSQCLDDNWKSFRIFFSHHRR